METRLPSFLLVAVLVILASVPTLANDIYLYPVGFRPLNSRVPVVPPREGGSQGLCFPLRVVRLFYPLEPYFQFPEGGHLSADVRYDKHPSGTRPFGLFDSTYSLRLAISDVKNHNQTQFIYAEGEKELAAVNLDPFPNDWTPVKLEWGGTTAALYREGKKVAEIKLKVPFAPTKLGVDFAWHVDELQLTGDGQLSLDWESGYAARVRPTPEAEDLLIPRLFGFDTHVISLDPAKRDCPMVQLINTGPDERLATVSFDLRSEVREHKHKWQQNITVPARSEAMVPVRFPFEMQTDVYHMKIVARETTPPIEENRHFMYVKLREEPAGPRKFGLHDTGPQYLGFWPDALPIHLEHKYALWRDIQWGMVPPEQWYWTGDINAGFYAGRTVYVCVQGTPARPWMRSKEYGKEFPRWKLKDDYVGGVPNYERYRRFLRVFAERYKGRIAFYEVENEAQGTHGFNCLKPEDYVQTCKAVYEEVKAADPEARVFGICGTGDFIGWMREVFELGAHQYMDGVSWHTYVTPHMPHEVDLTGKLAQANEVIAQTGKKMRIINSETGTKIALREEVDRPVSDARLQELIKAGRAGGESWPGHAMSERRGGASFVENVIVNFLAGAEYFTIFAWNSFIAPLKWEDCICWALFSAANKTEEKTPALHTLAVGVLTAQMEPAIHTKGRAIKQDGIQGGIFPKTNGGELAALWSTGAPRTISVRSKNRTLEYVNMLGQSSTLEGQENNGFYTHTITLEEEPCYIHASSPLTRFLPSPMQSVSVESVSASEGQIKCTLQNVFSGTWQGQISFKKEPGWLISPAKQNFTLQAGGQADLIFGYKVDSSVSRGQYSQPLAISLPNGRRYLSAVTIPVIPTIPIPRLPEVGSVAEIESWQPPGGSLLLNRMDQVVIGRPPELASLKEVDDWAGPEELSAEVKIGYDDNGLLVYVKVHDAHARLPQGWPGVSGSCVEFFFDFRPADGSYGPHLWQQGYRRFALLRETGIRH